MRVNSEEAILIFGVFTDTQYADKKRRGARFFKRSIKKLKQTVKTFNSHSLDFIVNLGDLIDGGGENIPTILEICNEFKAPLYHILGNHDYNISDDLKPKITELFSMSARYSSFMMNGWKIILLDGNEISFYAHPKDSPEYKFSAEYYTSHNIDKPEWDGGMGEEQLQWLDTELKRSEDIKENVIIFSHFPTYPDSRHALWNANEVFEIIDNYPCVKAYFAGHNHNGEYAKSDKTHFFVFKGMVDLRRNVYAIVQVYSDRLEIEGFGREISMILEIL